MDTQNLRTRASEAIAKLASKAEERGTDTSGADASTLKPGWVPGGDDFGAPVKPALLQEAIGFYDIAIGIDPSAGLYYRQALVFEKLSDFAAAVRAFESAFEKEPFYRNHYGFLLERCRAKLGGTYQPGAAMASNMEAMLGQALSKTPGLGSILKWAMKDVEKAAAAQQFTNQPDSRSAQFAKTEADKAEPHQAMTEYAESFVEALVQRDFGRAHAMLGQQLQKEYAAPHLERTFDDLVDGGNLGSADIHAESSMESWPAQADGERLWVYVSVQSEDVNEAVTVTIAERKGALRINTIEWGRP